MDAVLTNVRLATMQAQATRYGATSANAIAFDAGRIAWIGDAGAAPPSGRRFDGAGRWLTPGLIDCHTHLVHGGNRAREFEMRLTGASYEEIARAGGGINATVAATRAATEDELVAQALPRLRRLVEEGVTVVEIKSGYGLDIDNELKMLRAARRLGQLLPVTVRTTLLALHAVPRDYDGRPDKYVEFVCEKLIPTVARTRLADAMDGFCDRIGFTPAQTERAFRTAREYGLPLKLHAEQLSNQGGAELAARFGALSADHLEYADEAGVAAMAKAGTVAVLLPGAFFYLREKQLPPVELLRKHQVPIAIATDNNPGTSPYASLLLMMNMGCSAFLLTPEEALAGVTREAARALGMQDTHGTLEPGKAADAVLWDIDHPAELAYSFGTHRPAAVFRNGHETALPA
jgi:imidazolonepropionase